MVSQWATLSLKKKTGGGVGVEAAAAPVRPQMTSQPEAHTQEALSEASFPMDIDDEARARIDAVSSDEFERTFGRDDKAVGCMLNRV